MVSVHRYFMWNSFFDLFENDLDVEIDGRYRRKLLVLYLKLL